jgi:hypothetical protein
MFGIISLCLYLISTNTNTVVWEVGTTSWQMELF